MNQPNLLIIHTDQQSAWTLSAYGGELIDTPHIDRLGREGALFHSFFTNSAVCTPSRGCFLTGRYPHCHGAYANNIPLNRDAITLAHILLQNGYETGYAGKWHLDGTPRPGWVHPERSMGFADSRYMFNRGHWKRIEFMPTPRDQPLVFSGVVGDERTYTTDWLTDRTIEFIREARTAPFFYMVSFPDPHDPVDVRPPYDALYRPEDMPLPSTFSEASLPAWAERFRRTTPYALDRPDREERLRRRKAFYCGEVKLIDDSVGRLLDGLEQQGVLDETIVVFTTDHGEYMGEHGLYAKNQLYETAYRIPLLIRWPGGIPGGTIVDRMVATVDFQPTILGLGAPAFRTGTGARCVPFAPKRGGRMGGPDLRPSFLPRPGRHLYTGLRTGLRERRRAHPVRPEERSGPGAQSLPQPDISRYPRGTDRTDSPPSPEVALPCRGLVEGDPLVSISKQSVISTCFSYI